MEELLKYYANLLIVQYNGKPKASATINLLTWLIFVNLVFLQIQNSFDWKTATGNQLDIIGKWVGVSRTYNGSLFWGNEYFSYPKTSELYPSVITDELQHGYSDYSTFETDTGNILTYNSLGYLEQQLQDADYRRVIGLKIIKNSINHTAKNIDQAIWEYFGGQNYYSYQDYSLGTTLYADSELSTYKGVIVDTSNNKTVVAREVNQVPNETNWAEPDSLSSRAFLSVAYGNGVFVAGCKQGYISNSINGNEWSEPVQVGYSNGNFVSVAYGNNKFIACDNRGRVVYSVDGLNWSYPIQLNMGIKKIIYVNNLFIAVGGGAYAIAMSNNGIDWTYHLGNMSFDSVAYGNGVYVATSNDGLFTTSEDGNTWSTPEQIIDNSSFGSVQMTFGDNKFVAITRSWDTLELCYLTSADGVNWSDIISTNYMDFSTDDTTFKYINNKFIAINEMYIVSSDGINWSEPQLISETEVESRYFMGADISYGRNKYVVVGSYDLGDTASITTSIDDIVSFSEQTTFEYHNTHQVTNDRIYEYFLGDVYTTWDTPHQITYHYPSNMTTIMEVCNYKNVLLAPTGTQINIREIS